MLNYYIDTKMKRKIKLECVCKKVSVGVA